ncbi:MAG: hypothetical protein SVK08_06605 [Halobacteriota archaeon]|nr:hypothetical protein [Halobacteriota archaeon]
MNLPHHKSPIELHTQCLILSKIEIGDSLSEVQRKTGLSFTTVQKTMKELEKRKIIKTKENITERGRAKQSVKISQSHKNASIFFIDMIAKMSQLLSGPKGTNPLIFEAETLTRCLEDMRSSLPEDTLNVFNEWINEGHITEEDFNFFSQCFDIKVKVKKDVKNEQVTDTDKTLDEFM